MRSSTNIAFQIDIRQTAGHRAELDCDICQRDAGEAFLDVSLSIITNLPLWPTCLARSLVAAADRQGFPSSCDVAARSLSAGLGIWTFLLSVDGHCVSRFLVC
jgi:hypothetical protein